MARRWWTELGLWWRSQRRVGVRYSSVAEQTETRRKNLRKKETGSSGKLGWVCFKLNKIEACWKRRRSFLRERGERIRRE